MLYYLKRRDDIITVLNISDEGKIINYVAEIQHPELAPIYDHKKKNWLMDWWKNRAVPNDQGQILDHLRSQGLLGTEAYLTKNLGLSLTDYYWIAPVDSNLSWKDVNLFENDFLVGPLSLSERNASYESIARYTPNGSLQGTLEKSWIITNNGERGLLKGNINQYSSESINEVIASKIHESQGFKNYTQYELMEIKEAEYDYGCYSKLFTSTTLEFVSAYDIVVSEKQANDQSSFEHFISLCDKYGLKEEILRPFLDYMIMTDFIISNRDRHLNNVGVLRDSESLEFLVPAPIYDSGKSFFVQDIVPITDKELLNINTQSFRSNELGMLKLVRDRSLVDVGKLPSKGYIEEMYAMDSKMEDRRIKMIAEAYEKKVELFRKWQMGEKIR